jgi:signal transduction histidine kinase
MSFHAGSLIFSGLASLLLGAMAFWQGRSKLPNINLALTSLAVAIWCLAQAAGDLVPTKAEVLFWTRVNIGAAFFIPTFYLAFILSLLDRLDRGRVLLGLAALTSFIFLILDFTPFMVADVAPWGGHRYWAVFSPGYLLFALFLAAVFVYGVYKLVQAYRSSTGQRRNQILYVLLASVIGILGGATNFAPIFNLNFPALAHLFMPVYLVLTVYAIIRHQLLDIRVVFKRGLVYSILTALFTGLYLLLIFIFKEFFQVVTGWNSALAAAVMVLAFVLVFEPLRARLQEAVDRVFFRQKYDYQKTLQDLSAAAVSIFDETELKQKVIQTIKTALRVSSVSVLGEESDAVGFELSLPLISRGRYLGSLNLGPKLSGEMYSEEEINLLTTLANQVAVALENAGLYRQVIQSEKLTTIGTMAAGLAHEIKNPLASIKGLTQILPENVSDQEFLKKYVEIVPRQLDRINGILETLLRLGKSQKYAVEEVNLTKILTDLLRLFENQCRKQNIKLAIEVSEGLKIEGNAEALMQVFMNLVMNALEAMPQGGELKIKAEAKDKEKVEVEISDTGAGIKPEDQRRIFDPFFTTKEGGAGMGLAVTYRVIKEHKGEIEVESEIGKGTTFKIWLSIRPRA